MRERLSVITTLMRSTPHITVDLATIIARGRENNIYTLVGFAIITAQNNPMGLH